MGLFSFLNKPKPVPFKSQLAEIKRAVEKQKTLRDATSNDYQSAVAIMSAFAKTVSTRSEFLSQIEEIKRFYIVEVLLTSVAEDALTPEVLTGEVVELGSLNPKYNKSLKELQKRLDIDQTIRDIIVDVLAQGEHLLRLEVDAKNQKGVTRIVDDMDQSTVVAFYDEGYPHTYLRQDAKDGFVLEAPYHYAHFVLGNYKLRIEVRDEFNLGKSNFLDDFPAYVRIGRPLLYGVLSKVKELMMLEALVPASKINEVTRGSIIGLSVHNNLSIKEAFDLCKEYESVLNLRTGVNATTGEIAVADILEEAGKFKVIPIAGDKGELRVNEVRENRSLDELMNSVRDLRETICTSMGFPPELLFGGAEKAELLKRHARYLRKLKAIQTAIAKGLKQIGIIHLRNSGFKDATLDDVRVSFRNELVNIDELERLEYFEAVTAQVTRIQEFVTALMENPEFSDVVDVQAFKTWLAMTLSSLLKKGNFIKVGKKGKSPSDKGRDVDDDTDDSIVEEFLNANGGPF